MRYRLRTLLIVLALGLSVLAGAWVLAKPYLVTPPPLPEVIYWEPYCCGAGPVINPLTLAAEPNDD
jgi:hypothetical protein